MFIYLKNNVYIFIDELRFQKIRSVEKSKFHGILNAFFIFLGRSAMYKKNHPSIRFFSAFAFLSYALLH